MRAVVESLTVGANRPEAAVRASVDAVMLTLADHGLDGLEGVRHPNPNPNPNPRAP
jgi:hypothetical protein